MATTKRPLRLVVPSGATRTVPRPKPARAEREPREWANLPLAVQDALTTVMRAVARKD